MATWIEQADSDQYQYDRNGAGELTKHFISDRGSGEAEAATQGYTLGTSTTTVNSVDWIYSVIRIVPKGESGYEDVYLIYRSPNYEMSSRAGRPGYMDGVTRAANEEEWTVRGYLEQVPAIRAVDNDGQGFSGSWGVDKDDMVDQPVLELTWRKWMDKDNAVTTDILETVPRTQADAITVVDTYKPKGTGTYETSPPRLMKSLAATGTGAKLGCVSISVEPDGDLVVRTAIFKYYTGGLPPLFSTS